VIIKPQGKTVRRITINVDARGQAELNAENIEMPGVKGAMEVSEVALVLAQVLSSVVQAIHQAVMGRANAKTTKEDNNGTL